MGAEPLETEVKIRAKNLGEVRERLKGNKAVFLRKVREKNLVFDRNDELRKRGILLRLRSESDGTFLLSFKKVKERGRIKRSFEINCRVESDEKMKRILEAMGYGVAVTYEKEREVWKLGKTKVFLDRLRFGDYVEVEGDEIEIKNVLKLLGLNLSDAETKTYSELKMEKNSNF